MKKLQSYDEAKSYDETNTIPKSFNEKKATCKIQNFYILFAFLLIAIALLIVANIYCYLICKVDKKIPALEPLFNKVPVSATLLKRDSDKGVLL